MKVEFKNVSFKYYSSEEYIFEHLSFIIENNGMLAILGHNGSGKSTAAPAARCRNTPSGCGPPAPLQSCRPGTAPETPARPRARQTQGRAECPARTRTARPAGRAPPPRRRAPPGLWAG